ncbi:MAG TPA: tetratricopeptide repeat protein [Phenylobacterium sp.]|nr:tetratricopeptide repeat protein [Phenylobacterium sp.]
MIRVAGIYAVTAWGLFQIVKTVFDTMGAPTWAAQVALVLLAAGLPIAAIVAWAFERGPDGGVRRTRAAEPPAEGEEPPPKARIGWIDAMLLGGVALVVVLSVLQMTGVVGLPGQGKATVLAPEVPEKSVAVLPFANFSPNPEAEYFADGLTEEVINGLAQIPDLKVAGRTSVFYFKDKNEDLREIGRKLGVSHVVEGSVRREGDRLRVTAQLVTVSDGFHVWSKTYDRTVNDAFAIQTEIAASVAEALKTKLAVTGQASAAQARDPRAYQLELVAKAQYRRLTRTDLLAAREKYRQLIKMEPNNPSAHAGFALATMIVAQNHLALDFADARRESEAALNRALALDPNNIDALTAKGMVNLVLGMRTGRPDYFTEGEAALKKVITASPRNGDALALLANLAGRAGRPKEAEDYARRALAVDPLNRLAQGLLASSLRLQGRMQEAEAQYRSMVEFFPDYPDAKLSLAQTLIARGAFDQAEPWLAAAAGPGNDASSAINLTNLYMNLGMRAEAEAAIAGMDGSEQEKVIGRVLSFYVREDWRGAVAFAEANMREDEDPWWPQVASLAALQLGDYERARRYLTTVAPEMFQPEPVVNAEAIGNALQTAHVAKTLGDAGQARRLLLGVLKQTERPAGVYLPNDLRIARSRAYAELGDRTRAIAELRTAIQSGWRSLYDMEDFLWLDRHYNTRSLHGDPEFKALIGQVRADLAAQRARVLARRAPAARPAA